MSKSSVTSIDPDNEWHNQTAGPENTVSHAANESTVDDAVDQEDIQLLQPPVRFRTFLVYRTAVIILFSHLSFKFKARFHSEQWVDRQRSILARRNAKRIYQSILKVQGLFVKIGQMMSIVGFAVPEEVRQELGGLQDRVPPRPGDNIISQLESDFEKPIDEIFSQFNCDPIASASLAQVHLATMLDGSQVVVKVQHRDIDKTVEADLKVFRRIVTFFDIFLRLRGLKRSLNQTIELVLDELDFTKEAKNLAQFQHNFKGDAIVRIPKIYPEYCTPHVITMERCVGVKPTDPQALALSGFDKETLAQNILHGYCRMVFKDGLIHADPHPGNMMVNADGEICLLDFGSVVRISPQFKQGATEFVYGVLTRNNRRMIKGLKKMKSISPTADDEKLEKIIEFSIDYFLGSDLSVESFSLEDIDIKRKNFATLLIEFQAYDVSFKEVKESFQMPKEAILLERMALILAGLLHDLDPAMKPIDTLLPYLQSYLFGSDGNLQKTMKTLALETGMDALKVMSNAKQLIERANRGELELAGEKKQRQMHYYLFQQFISILFFFVASGFTYVAWQQGQYFVTQGAGAVAVSALLWALKSSWSASKSR